MTDPVPLTDDEVAEIKAWLDVPGNEPFPVMARRLVATVEQARSQRDEARRTAADWLLRQTTPSGASLVPPALATGCPGRRNRRPR